MDFPNRLTALETFCEYLEDELKISGGINIKIIKHVLLRALKDYFAGNISVGYLEVTANQLYFHLGKPHQIDASDRELSKYLSIAGEIGYQYEQINGSEKNKEEFDQVIAELRKYLKENQPPSTN